MTALTSIAVLMAALWIGYQFGRRAVSSPTTWKQRTSRLALGRLTVTLVALIVARRVQLKVQRKTSVSGRPFTQVVPSLAAMVGVLCSQLAVGNSRRPHRRAALLSSRRGKAPARASARRTASY